MMKPLCAWALALATVWFAGPAWASQDDAVIVYERLEYSRVIQSVNVALSDQVRALPSPDLLRRHPEQARAALQDWVAESRLVIAAQRFKLVDPTQYAPPEPFAAAEIEAQRQILFRFIAALEILTEQFDFYSQTTDRMVSYSDWCLDAYYDAQMLGIRVTRDLTASQARLEPNPLISSSLNVFARSAEIQLLLARAGHNRAHAAHLNAGEWASSLARTVNEMDEALALAYAALATSTIDSEGWAAALAYEAMIVSEARGVASALSGRTTGTLAGRNSGLDRLIELYRNRPTRDMVFATAVVL